MLALPVVLIVMLVLVIQSAQLVQHLSSFRVINLVLLVASLKNS